MCFVCRCSIFIGIVELVCFKRNCEWVVLKIINTNYNLSWLFYKPSKCNFKFVHVKVILLGWLSCWKKTNSILFSCAGCGFGFGKFVVKCELMFDEPILLAWNLLLFIMIHSELQLFTVKKIQFPPTKIMTSRSATTATISHFYPTQEVAQNRKALVYITRLW